MDLEERLAVVALTSRIPYTRVLSKYNQVYDKVSELIPNKTFSRYQELAFNRTRLWARAYGRSVKQ